MRTPSTTDLSFTLCDDWVDPAKTESQVSPFLFQNLLPELQPLMIAQFDMPTRWAFRWTCKQYYADGAPEEFDCFAFADKCAELGYRTLLEYSIERGGPFDFETSEVAAAHGHVGVLQLFVRRQCQNNLKLNLVGVKNDQVTEWTAAAARTGRMGVLSWLKFAEWRNADELGLGRAAIAALVQAQNLALEVLQRVKSISHENGQQVAGILLKKAYACGLSHIEVIKRIWEMEYQLDPFSQRYVHPTFISWYLDNHPLVAVASQLPALLNMGKTSGDAALIRLAVERGATISLDDFDPRSNNGELPKPQVLRYLHERFGLDSAPFKGRYPIPSGISKDDLQWMHEQGYQFEMKNCSSHYLSDSELLPLLFQMGFRPTYHDIREAARNCRLDLLDVFFRQGEKEDLSDTKLITIYLTAKADRVRASRIRLKPILKTLQWLLDHGYTADTSIFDHFVRAFMDHKPKLLSDSFEVISALNMPLSAETCQRVTDFMAKKQ